MPICLKCNKLFRRTPIHKKRKGTLIRSRAKYCPGCRKELRKEVIEINKLLLLHENLK